MVSGVRKFTLGEIGPVRMCKRIMKDETSPDGEIPFFKIGTFGGKADVFISRERYEEYKSKYPYPKRGDVLISAAGTIGRLVVFDGGESYFQDCNIVWVENDETKVTNECLHYALQLARWKPSQGSTILRLYNDDIRAVEFFAPDSLLDQRHVASILSTIDRKIALNRKRIATLEAMAKEIYDYWFVQFDFPDAHGRPYKSSGGAMVYNPDLKRKIPKGWEVVRIGDVLDRHILNTNKIPAKAYGQFGAYPIIDQSEKFIAGYTDDKNAILDYPFCTVFGDHSCELKAVNFPFARGADGTQIVVSADANVPNVQLYFALRMMDFGGGYKRHFVLLKDSLIVKDAIGVVAPRFEKVEETIFDGIKHCRFENLKLIGLRDFLLPLLMNGQVKVG